jgi:hypothetical protein
LASGDQEVLELKVDLAGTLRSVPRSLGQAPHDQVDHALGALRRTKQGEISGLIEDFEEEPVQRLCIIRLFAGKQFEGQNTERINVSKVIDAPGSDLFGSHIRWRSYSFARPCHLRLGGTRDAKIHEPNAATRVEVNVRWLHITMGNAQSMDGLQG